MQYRVSFLLLVISTAFFLVVDYIAVLVFFFQVPVLAGWTLGEVSALFGLSAICLSLAELFAAGFDTFSTQIVQGTFDRVLVRPLGAFFQTFASDLRAWRLSRTVQGAVILVIGLSLSDIDWSPTRVAVLLGSVVFGSTIFFTFFVIGAAMCFWTVQSMEAINTLTNGGNFVASFPLDIFQSWLRRFLTFVLPIAFVNYYPMLYVFGRPDPLGLPWWTSLLSPIAALAMMGIAALCWRGGVRRYQSTGS